jgi:O-antigen/teichoic acid export membrane protein
MNKFRETFNMCRLFQSAKSNSAFSVLDQAVFSGVNFALNLYLARELGPAGYGLFAIVYAIVFLVNAIQLGAIAEPVTVLWPRSHSLKGQYTVTVLTLTGITCVILAGVTLFSATNIVSIPLSLDAALALSLALFPLSYFWILRQICYADGHPRRALFITIFYAAGLTSTVIVCDVFFTLSVLHATVGLAVGAVAAIVAYCSIDGAIRWVRVPWLRMISISSYLWRYARWSAPSGVLIWLSGTIFLFMLSSVSLAEAGEYRAFTNMIIPVQQIMLGLSLVVLPNMSRLNRDGEESAFRRVFNKVAIVAIVLSLAYSAVLVGFLDIAYDAVYGAEYNSISGMLWFAAALPLIGSLVTVYRMACRALNSPAVVFYAHALGVMISVLAAITLGWYESAGGALLATVVQSAVVFFILVVRTNELLPRISLHSASRRSLGGDAGEQRVAVFGLPFSDNLGDGLIARCLREGLTRRGLSVSSIDLAGRWESTGSGNPRRRAWIKTYFAVPEWLRKPVAGAFLFVFSSWLEEQFRRRLVGTDVVLVGGGNLFADHDLNFPLKLKAVFRATARANLPVLIVGVGVASSWSSLGRRILARSLENLRLEYVSVRDGRSAENWKCLGFKGDPAIVRDFGLLASQVFPAGNRTHGTVGLCVMSPASLTFHGTSSAAKVDLTAFWIGLAERLSNVGLKPVFFNNGSAEDVDFMKDLSRHHRMPDGVRIVQPVTVEELCGVISSLDSLVAFRMHAVITAYSYGVPFVALAWDEKLESFLKSVDLEERLKDVADGPMVVFDTLVALRDRSHLTSDVAGVIAEVEGQMHDLRQRLHPR